MDAADAARRRRHRNERIVAAAVVLLFAAAAVAITLWSRSQRELPDDTTYIPKPVALTPEMLLLRDYVRIDTSTPQGEAIGARWLARTMETHGIQPELIPSGEGRLNVYARLRGRQRGGALLLFNHIDVVPPGPGWTQPPFEGKITVDTLHGRGTIDMKALAICQLMAMAELVRSHTVPQHDLIFLATADEETGSVHGMRWLLANRPDLFEGVEYGITEGGITEMLTERMTYFGIEIGSKQLVEAILTAPSAEALRRARIALEPHIMAWEPDRILPAVDRMFRGLAPTRVRYRAILSDVQAAARRGDFWQLPISYRDLTQNSLWVSAPWVDAGTARMRVRMVNLPDEEPEHRLEWLAGAVAPFGARIESTPTREGPVPLSNDRTPLFDLIGREAKARYQVDPGVQVLYRSTSDARFLRPRGITCYGVSPYPIDYYESVTIHHANERIRLDRFASGLAFMKNVVTQWASGI